MLNPATAGVVPENYGFTPILYTAWVPAAATTWKPSALFPSWAEDGTNITVPIASFDVLTAADADADTGDARQVISSICTSMFDYLNDLSTKPEAVTARVSQERMLTSGSFSGKQKIIYQFTINRDHLTRLVADEP